MSLPLTTLIELGGLRFLITDKPTKANVPLCVDVFKKLGVTALVRVCHEEDYDTTPIQNAGITCYVSLSVWSLMPPPAPSYFPSPRSVTPNIRHAQFLTRIVLTFRLLPSL